MTGASGYLGTALVDELSRLPIAELRLLSRSARSLSSAVGGPRVVTVVGSILDPDIVEGAASGAHVVFHLAAMKSIAQCEARPERAIATNVDGTRTLLSILGRVHTLEHLVAVSSVSASEPSSVYGMTKALMEKIVGAFQLATLADVGSVRLGGLWGSPDSVVARWNNAARTGDVLEMTDPEMTRFMMSRADAVELLLRALDRKLAGGVLARMMKAYRVGDLADVFARRYDVVTRIIGRTFGEKQHEDLVAGPELAFATRTQDQIQIYAQPAVGIAEPISSRSAQRITPSELLALVDSLG